MDQTLRMLLACAAGTLSLGLLTTSPALIARAQTFVTPRGEAQNVRFEQLEDGVLHISYDLISSEPRAVFSVRLEVSQDGGTTFGMRPQSITGDTGDGITPGTNKRIVWDSGKDVERVQIDRFRFRVVATGGPLQVEGAAAPPTEDDKPAAGGGVPNEPRAPVAGKGGGGRAKWLIPLVGGGGLAAVLAGRSGGGTSTASATSAAQCLFTLSPNSFTLAAAGGSTRSVSVSTTAGCVWTATSNASFLGIAGPASFVGSDSVSFSAETNSGTTRTGTLSVAGQSVTVTQIAPGPDTVTVVGLTPPSGSTLAAGPAGTAGATATVSYFLGSRETAFICVQPDSTNTECGPRAVTRGTGTVAIRFSLQANAPNLPRTTTRLVIFVGDTSTFGSTTFLTVFEPATFTWTRP